MRYLLVRLKASARLLRSNKFRLFGAPEFSIPASAGEASCSFIISPGLPMNAVRGSYRLWARCRTDPAHVGVVIFLFAERT